MSSYTVVEDKEDTFEINLHQQYSIVKTLPSLIDSKNETKTNSFTQ